MRYRFFSDTNFALFCEAAEDWLVKKDPAALTVELREDIDPDILEFATVVGGIQEDQWRRPRTRKPSRHS